VTRVKGSKENRYNPYFEELDCAEVGRQPKESLTPMGAPSDNRISLRVATRADCRRLWVWRNDVAAREGSFDSEAIPYEIHEKWFAGKIDDPCTHLLIVINDRGLEVGYVRFDVGPGTATISVAIDSRERRKGYGLLAIKRGVEHIFQHASVSRVVAQIRRENLGSALAFRRAGFRPVRKVSVRGIEGHEMVYEPGASE